ncbi:uncharacterized protein LOC132755824 [Ruditapes philippinarum]|uniref:uncharacterized protein LOC132755824 n=1 Tax=Ruditapes philippinarum TaxID=129788 RepID=UPI00295B6BE9|nr:uncharacterized protein LOC132755824 [Ruditapes philippinarum]
MCLKTFYLKDQSDPILTDTIVDRAAENDSEYIVCRNPDTLGDFLDIESGDSMSVDIDAVDEIADSHTLDDVFVIETNDETVDITESDDDSVNIEAIALQNDQDEVDITTARNDIDDTYNDIVDNDDNLFGIMSLYIKSDLHFDLQNIPASAEHSGQKKDFGYKFFSFSTFFK